MPRLEASTEINRSPDCVFDACLAVHQIPGYTAWNPTFARGLRMVAQTDGTGTAWEFDLESPGATGRAEIVVYEPPSLLRARMTGGIFVDLVSEFRLSPVEDRTLLTRIVQYRLRYQPVSMFVDIAMLRGRLKADVRDGLQAMKARAESNAVLAA